jgi:hypothetical protein
MFASLRTRIVTVIELIYKSLLPDSGEVVRTEQPRSSPPQDRSQAAKAGLRAGAIFARTEQSGPPRKIALTGLHVRRRYVKFSDTATPRAEVVRTERLGLAAQVDRSHRSIASLLSNSRRGIA